MVKVKLLPSMRIRMALLLTRLFHCSNCHYTQPNREEQGREAQRDLSDFVAQDTKNKKNPLKSFDFREFWSEWSDSNARPREPKSRALPTALHPDIRFFCMIPCREGKSKFFVSVGGAVVTPNFAGVFQLTDFHRKLLSQGLPGFRFWGNG